MTERAKRLTGSKQSDPPVFGTGGFEDAAIRIERCTFVPSIEDGAHVGLALMLECPGRRAAKAFEHERCDDAIDTAGHAAERGNSKPPLQRDQLCRSLR